MPVTTPQLDMPVYQAPPTPPPMPEGQPAQVLPPQAGFVSKAGAGAFLANNVLQGWLKGREIRAQRELQKAQTAVSGADQAYKIVSENYNNLLRAGKTDADPEVQKAKQAAMVAWNAYTNTLGQYTMPAEPAKGQKKSVKEKVEGGFGQLFGKSGITPQLIAQTSLQVLKSSAPPGLGLTPQDRLTITQEQLATEELKGTKTANEAATLKLEHDRRTEADDAEMQRIVKIPEGERTLKDNQWLEGWNRVQHINDPEQRKFADSIMKKIENGQELTAQERNFAYAQGLMQGPQTVMRTDASGKDQLVSYLPDGKVLGTTNLGRHYEPDQTASTMHLIRAQRDLMVQSALESMPGIQEILRTDPAKRTPQQIQQLNTARTQAMQLYVLDSARNPAVTSSFLTDNPVQQEKNLNAVSKAIYSVWMNAGGPMATPDQRKHAQEQMMNFVSGDPRGAGHFMVFRDQLAGPSGTSGMLWWKKPQWTGGLTSDAIKQQQTLFYEQVRSALQAQNPTWNAGQLDAAMPQWLKEPGAQPPAPTQGGPQQQTGAQPQMAAPPKPQGEGLVSKGARTAGNLFMWPYEAAFNRGQALFPPPGSQDLAGPGPDGVYGQKTANTKLYQVKTEDKHWVSTWLTPDQAEELKQQMPDRVRLASQATD